MTKKRTAYSDTFKAEAVAKLKENDNNVTQTAKELGIPMNTLKNWLWAANSGKLAGTDTYSPDIIALQEENRELKKQLKIAQEEREILKKATAYFANEEG